MFLRRSTAVKYSIAVAVGAALYCEWFIYLAQPMYWKELKCSNPETLCTKILFIADPQIQGDLAVAPPLSYLFNWDSDRFLKSSFSVVLKYLKPDILVFMGDLTDEGSISTMSQFHGYVKRLSNIFDVDYPVVQIWIPGDNDIGGENEPVKKDKVTEFEKVFHQPSVMTFQNISFYKVNGIIHKYPKKLADIEQQDNYNIVVSHYAVTNKHVFGNQVNNEIKPNIYFCAHEHESKYVKQRKDLTSREMHSMLSYTILDVAANDEMLYEIYVPTCSYRMGTSDIGFGAAVFDHNNRNLSYTVFWSPQRFPYLCVYLVLVIILIVYLLIYCTAKLFHRRNQSVARSSDKVPLFERI